MGAFEFAEAVWFFIVLVGGSIVSDIYIPPGVIIVDAVPSVLGGGFIRNAIDYIARDVLATAKGGEEIGEIVADTFMCAQCFANIEILDECAVVIVVLKVIYDPLIVCFDLIFVGFTASTNFVSKFFCLCVP